LIHEQELETRRSRGQLIASLNIISHPLDHKRIGLLSDVKLLDFKETLGSQDCPCVALQIAAADRVRPSRLYATPNNLLALFGQGTARSTQYTQ
jgi:hypothetical protein